MKNDELPLLGKQCFPKLVHIEIKQFSKKDNEPIIGEKFLLFLKPVLKGRI